MKSRIYEDKGPFPVFSGFPRCFSDPLQKGEKAEKGRKRPISANLQEVRSLPVAPQTPHLLHPHLWQPIVSLFQRFLPLKDRDWTSLSFCSGVCGSQGVGVDAARLIWALPRGSLFLFGLFGLPDLL